MTACSSPTRRRHRRRLGVAVAALALAAGTACAPRPAGQAPAEGVVAAASPVVRARIDNSHERVLVIGIDGMTWAVALELINRGELPTFARLVRTRPHGILRAPEPLISPLIWTTMATGRPPAVHGIDGFKTRLAGSYGEEAMTTRFRRVPALWNMVSWGPRTVAVVGWNAATPAEAVSGVFVADGVASDHTDPRLVSPPELTGSLLGVEPLVVPELAAAFAALPPDSQAAAAQHGDRHLAAITLAAMEAQPPDLAMVYLRGVDVVSHLYWKHRWPTSLDRDFAVGPGEQATFGAVIENQYRLVDTLVARLQEAMPGATTIVVSDHGNGPVALARQRVLSLNRLLERLGYLRFSNQPTDTVLRRLVATGVLRVPPPSELGVMLAGAALARAQARRLGAGAPPLAGAALLAALGAQPEVAVGAVPEEELAALAASLAPGFSVGSPCWSATTVFNAEDSKKAERGLHLNLAGREPEGVVAPARAVSLLAELRGRLAALRTEHDQPLFASVRVNPERSDAVPTGLTAVADLLVEINYEALLATRLLRRPGDPDPIPLAPLTWLFDEASADHVTDGVFAIDGPHAAGAMRLDVSPLDLAPTILWRLGYPVGADMPGRVLTEAFADQAPAPLTIASWTAVVPPQRLAAAPLDPAAERLLIELGYVESGNAD